MQSCLKVLRYKVSGVLLGAVQVDETVHCIAPTRSVYQGRAVITVERALHAGLKSCLFLPPAQRMSLEVAGDTAAPGHTGGRSDVQTLGCIQRLVPRPNEG